MPVATDTNIIKEKVRDYLVKARRDGVYLRLVDERFEDNWLYLIIAPEQGGGRASEHARLMARIERDLRAQGYDQVLLVPARAD